MGISKEPAAQHLPKLHRQGPQLCRISVNNLHYHTHQDVPKHRERALHFVTWVCNCPRLVLCLPTCSNRGVTIYDSFRYSTRVIVYKAHADTRNSLEENERSVVSRAKQNMFTSLLRIRICLLQIEASIEPSDDRYNSSAYLSLGRRSWRLRRKTWATKFVAARAVAPARSSTDLEPL